MLYRSWCIHIYYLLASLSYLMSLATGAFRGTSNLHSLSLSSVLGGDRLITCLEVVSERDGKESAGIQVLWFMHIVYKIIILIVRVL